MKKYITLMLASALILSAVSCGSDSKANDETTTSDAGTTAADETTAPEETDGLPEKTEHGSRGRSPRSMSNRRPATD